MSLLGTIITLEQIAAAELPELEALYAAVKDAIDQKNAAADTQAAILGADEAVDAKEEIMLAQKKGELP